MNSSERRIPARKAVIGCTCASSRQWENNEYAGWRCDAREDLAGMIPLLVAIGLHARSVVCTRFGGKSGELGDIR